MFCPECGNQNPNTAKFCIKCGYQYTQPSNTQTPNYPPPEVEQHPYSSQLRSSSMSHSQNTSRPQSSGKKVFVGATVAILLIGIVVIGGIVAFIAYQEQQRSRSSYSPSNSSPQDSQPLVPQIRRGSQRLVEQAFTVGPGRYYYVKFTIPENWRSATVVGNFSASGGEGNDIQVLITDERGFTNIKNGHSGRVWYDSGKVTTDNINTALAPGTYYIVFSNSFSVISNKALNSDIQLQYEY